MHIFDTLIIGSGYFSAGYALHGNCIICEENQVCDNHFYLPLRDYTYVPYAPKTEEGKRLQEIFVDLGLFSETVQNLNGFESGFCKYLTDSDIEILLKCRVIRAEKMENGIYDITIHTNEGLLHKYAKQVIDTREPQKDTWFTILFTSENIEADKEQLLRTFDGAYVEKAFYENWYALHIKTESYNENDIKLYVYNQWKALDIHGKILYMAPVFYSKCEDNNVLLDSTYKNPIKAFEAGYFYAKEAAK